MAGHFQANWSIGLPVRLLFLVTALLIIACMQTEDGKSPTEGIVPPPICELNLSPDTARIMKFHFSSKSFSETQNSALIYTALSDSEGFRTFAVRDSGRKQLSYGTDTIDSIDTDTVQVPVFEFKLMPRPLRDLGRTGISHLLRVKGCMYSFRDSSLSESGGAVPNGTITHVRVDSDSIVISLRYRNYTAGSGYDMTYASDGQLLSRWMYWWSVGTQGEERFTRIPIDSIATPSSLLTPQ